MQCSGAKPEYIIHGERVLVNLIAFYHQKGEVMEWGKSVSKIEKMVL